MAAAGPAEKVSVAVSVALALCLVVLFLPFRPSEVAPRPAHQTQAEMPAAPAETPDETPSLAQIVLPPPPNLGRDDRRPDAPAAETNSRPEPPSEPPPLEIPAEPQLVLKPMKAAPRAAPPPKPLTPLAPPAERPPPEIVRRAPEPPRQDQQPQPAEPDRRAPPPQAREESAPTDKVTVSLEEEDVAQGRILLRMLEHGAGPSIEIAWPDSERQRDRLFERLRSCYGMRLAVMDAQDRLYVADGARGVPWNLNLDRYSGFIRQPAGLLAAAERRALADIQSYHARLHGAVLVRLFPRQIDALLLGGLRQIIGENYGGIATIHARYRMEGSGVIIERIEVDRRSLPGRIDLSPGARRRCRRSA